MGYDDKFHEKYSHEDFEYDIGIMLAHSRHSGEMVNFLETLKVKDSFLEAAKTISQASFVGGIAKGRLMLRFLGVSVKYNKGLNTHCLSFNDTNDKRHLYATDFNGQLLNEKSLSDEQKEKLIRFFRSASQMELHRNRDHYEENKDHFFENIYLILHLVQDHICIPTNYQIQNTDARRILELDK